MNDVNGLAQRLPRRSTVWPEGAYEMELQVLYRICSKYRRKVFYEEKRHEKGKILRTLCNWKKKRIVEAEMCLDHEHMLVEIPPRVARRAS